MGKECGFERQPPALPSPLPGLHPEHSRPPESQLPPHGRTVTRCRRAHVSAHSHLLISTQRDARSWLWRAAAFPGITCRKATHLPSGAFRRARKKQRNSGKENEARAAANTSPGEEPRGGGRERPAGPGSSVAPARRDAAPPDGLARDFSYFGRRFPRQDSFQKLAFKTRNSRTQCLGTMTYQPERGTQTLKHVTEEAKVMPVTGTIDF